jgi:hypothetical protein
MFVSCNSQLTSPSLTSASEVHAHVIDEIIRNRTLHSQLPGAYKGVSSSLKR